MPRFLQLLLVLVLANFAGAAEPDSEAARREALARYGLGLWRSRTELPTQAIKHYEAAAKADPASAEPQRPLVKLYADFGRDAAAIRTARSVLEKDPDDFETAHTLGKLLYEGRKFAGATKALKQAAGSPRVKDRLERRVGIQLDLARVGEASGDFTSAEAALSAALELSKDANEVASLHERIGRARAARGDYTGAVTAYREAHKRFADPAGANEPAAAARLDWNLSGVLTAEGKPEAALVHLERFLALKPSGIEPYERYSDLMHRTGQSQLVATALRRSAETNAKNPRIRWVLASEVGRTDPEAAETLFREIARTTNDPEFFRRFVRFEKDAGHMEGLLNFADETYTAARGGRTADDEPDAEKPAGSATAIARARSLTAAIKAAPDLAAVLVRQAASDLQANANRHADTWEVVAFLAERDGQLDAAVRALRASLRQNSTAAFGTLYRILSNQRKWAEILKAIDDISAAQRFGKGQRNRVFDHFKTIPLAELGREQEALDAADRSVIVKTPLEVRLSKAQIFDILGKHREAVAECEDAIKHAHTPAEVHRVRITLSNSLLGLRKFPDAEAELRKLLDEDPDDVLVLNNLGYNLADQGRKLDEAESLIRRAIELDRDERLKSGEPEAERGTYLDSLGWVLFRRGNHAEGRKYLEAAANSSDAGSDAIVWDHLGDVCFRTGDKTKAREAWTKAADLYQNSHQGTQFGRRDEALRKLRLVP